MTAAILAVRPAAPPGNVLPKGATIDLVRLFALNCSPVGRRPLVCHWRCGADGRLASIWEPDIALIPHR